MQSSSLEQQKLFVRCRTFDWDYRLRRIYGPKMETINICPVVIKRLSAPSIDAERDMSVDEAVSFGWPASLKVSDVVKTGKQVGIISQSRFHGG